MTLSPRPFGWTDAVLLLVGYAVAIGVLAWAGGFRGYDRSPELVLATFVGTLAIAAVTQYAAWLRGPSIRQVAVLVAIAISAPVALFVFKYGVSSLYDGAVRWWPSKPGLRCMRLSMADGSAMLAGALASRRRSGPFHPAATGAAMGAAAGAGSWVLVDLWCPVGAPTHLLLGHVIPTLALTALGAWPGSLVLRARRSTA